ncbi:FecR domain-containing protein [Adonisia turfae]|uniref:FecR protein domain-containing protein n=1 Tax=Adonisia turfae CCMR0081 TaxID=2292702 RepID=A0A6M0RR72_9CYAN|nr:FecR domain-containing protein [Adonisia turfae]NEZ58370.1 hypothetical protein [Adonisia turfae CCMR0081]
MEKLNVTATGRWLSLVCASLGILLAVPRSASAQSALTWARIELTRNQVQLFTDGRSRRARVSDVLGVGDALSTARRARAELRFNDGSLARIGESAVFQFTPNTRNFRLSNGTVLLLIPPGQGRTTIQTPNAVTGIHGSALFVRFVPDTNTTIIGALTNNPEGPMMAFNEDGSAQQPLYAGEMAVLHEDGKLELFSFDLHEFYATSDLVTGLLLDNPEASTGDEAIDAVRQEIQEALEGESFEDGDDVIQNPEFLSANSSNRIASSTTIPDFSLSPAADFLQQRNINERFDNTVNATVNQPDIESRRPNPPGVDRPNPQPPARPNPPTTPKPPVAPRPVEPTNPGGPTTPGGPTPGGPGDPGGPTPGGGDKPDLPIEPPNQPTPNIPAPVTPEPTEPISQPTPGVEPIAPTPQTPPEPSIPEPAPSPPVIDTPVIVGTPEPTVPGVTPPPDKPAPPIEPIAPEAVIPPDNNVENIVESPIEVVPQPETEVQIDRLPDAVAEPPVEPPAQTAPVNAPPGT